MLVDAPLLSRLADDAGFIEPQIVVQPLVLGAPRVELARGEPLYPASMIKLPIAFALAEACAAGTASLTQTVTVAPANLTVNDAPSALVEGYTATLGELGHGMLAASDNVATNVLIDVLGRAAIDRTCARLGLTHTHVGRKLSGSLPLIDDPQASGRNAHSARDAATLFARLAAARSPAWIWDALVAQVWNDKLSRGLDAEDAFAHKTGDTDEVSHDGGVLRLGDGRQFVLVVYTALASNAASDARHAAFMRALRPYLVA